MCFIVLAALYCHPRGTKANIHVWQREGVDGRAKRGRCGRFSRLHILVYRSVCTCCFSFAISTLIQLKSVLKTLHHASCATDNCASCRFHRFCFPLGSMKWDGSFICPAGSGTHGGSGVGGGRCFFFLDDRWVKPWVPNAAVK